MKEIIHFESQKQLYALGLVDQHNRIAACFVDPNDMHPKPEIVAVPLTQLGLLHIGHYYNELLNADPNISKIFAGKTVQHTVVNSNKVHVSEAQSLRPAPYELSFFRKPELYNQYFHDIQVGHEIYKIPDSVIFSALTASCSSSLLRLILSATNIERYINRTAILPFDRYWIALTADAPFCLSRTENSAWLYCALKYQFTKCFALPMSRPDTCTPFSRPLSCQLPQLPYACYEIEYVTVGSYRFVLHLRIRDLPAPSSIIIEDHREHATFAQDPTYMDKSSLQCRKANQQLELDSGTGTPQAVKEAQIRKMEADNLFRKPPKIEHRSLSKEEKQLRITEREPAKASSKAAAFSTNSVSKNGDDNLLPVEIVSDGYIDFSVLPARFRLICDALQNAYIKKIISMPHCSVWHNRCYNSFIGLNEIQQTNRSSYSALLAIAICHGNHIGILEIYPDGGSSISCAATLIICGSDDESIYRRALRLVQSYKDTAGHWIKHNADDTAQQAVQRSLVFEDCLSVRHTSNYVNLLCGKLCSLKS